MHGFRFNLALFNPFAVEGIAAAGTGKSCHPWAG